MLLLLLSSGLPHGKRLFIYIIVPGYLVRFSFMPINDDDMLLFREIELDAFDAVCASIS